MELNGKITEIGEVVQVTDSFKKRVLVIVTPDQYPQTLGIEFVQDKVSVLDNYKVGDDVLVGINIRGRSYENKDFETQYITSLQGWKIVKNG